MKWWEKLAQANEEPMPADAEEVDMVQSEPGEKAAPAPSPKQQQLEKQPIDRARMPVELQNRMRGVMPGAIMQRNRGIMNSPDFYRMYQDLGAAHWFGTSNPRKMENRLNKPEPLPPTKNDPKKPLVETKPQPPQPTKATSPAAKQPGPTAPAWQGQQVQPTSGKKASLDSPAMKFATHDTLDMWAAYCKNNGLPFEQFARGADLLLSDREYYENEGFPALERATSEEDPRQDFPGLDALGRPIKKF
jgi:hypothetical protein